MGRLPATKTVCSARIWTQYSPILPRWGAFPPRPAITLDQKNEEVGNAIKAMCDGKKLVYTAPPAQGMVVTIR